MKLGNLIIFAALLMGTGAMASEELSNTVAISKVTELGVHRIERLVALKKIDSFFLTGLTSLRAELSQENGAAFKVSAYTAPAEDGTSLSLTLWMDGQGKTLSHQVNDGIKSLNPFPWPLKDAASLMEEGLHFVLEGWAQAPEVKPYYTGLKTIVLTPGQDAEGNLIAQFVVTSEETPQTLIIKLKPDGTFISHELK